MPRMPLIQFRCSPEIVSVLNKRAETTGETTGEIARAALCEYLGVAVPTFGVGLAAADDKTRQRVAKMGGEGKKLSAGNTKSTKDLRRGGKKLRKKSA